MADETRQASRIGSGGAAATVLMLGVPAGHVVPLLALLVLAAFTWWLRAPLHAMPLDRDEGAYAVIAERWLAGDALYRDLFDHKPPLVYMVFSIAVLAPGDPVVAVRILATGYLLVIGASLYMLGLRLYGHRVAFVATALLLAYGSSRRFEGLIFNTEAILELPATLSCLFAVDALLEDRPLRLFWAGLCVGLAVLAKPIGLALLGPLLLVPLLARWPWQRARIAAALSTLGVALPVMIF
ncbi:MAG: glycosyltransferase family 39 protein, partial [Oscillochloris sp.]|nr:glycosyltransferase family 39 protein [Oscillochloris sp.]